MRKWISQEAIVTAGESGLVNRLRRFLKKQGGAQLEALLYAVAHLTHTKFQSEQTDARESRAARAFHGRGSLHNLPKFRGAIDQRGAFRLSFKRFSLFEVLSSGNKSLKNFNVNL